MRSGGCEAGTHECGRRAKGLNERGRFVPRLIQVVEYRSGTRVFEVHFTTFSKLRGSERADIGVCAVGVFYRDRMSH